MHVSRLSQNPDLTKIPSASTSNRLHISRAYHQCRLCREANVGDGAVSLNHEYYAYQFGNDKMEPIIVKQPVRPTKLPEPGECKKCARGNMTVKKVT